MRKQTRMQALTDTYKHMRTYTCARKHTHTLTYKPLPYMYAYA